jgi:sec-independent protein translocase protein TatC
MNAPKPLIPGPDGEEDLDESGTMTFWEHLAELRSRVVRAAIAFVIGGTIAWFYRDALLAWITLPFDSACTTVFKEGCKLNYSGVASGFVAYLKLSLLAGFVFALPIIFYQLWAFIAPGLYQREKRFALPFVLCSTLLFLGGSFFCWKFVLPRAFLFLLQVADDINPVIMVDEYLAFFSRLILAFGAAFELPMVVLFLSIAGIVNHTHLIKFWRYFVVVAFLMAAILTPPDLLSQFMLALPLCVLYAVSIGLAYIFGKKPEPSPS